MSKLIAIDNGHGLHTAGKRTPVMDNGKVIHEWQFNHPTAKLLEVALRRCGFRTLMVSDTSADTPLRTRTTVANNAKADLFISIHYNAYKGTWGSHGGIETLYHATSSKSKSLAIAIQRQLIASTDMRNRGTVARDNLHVLRATNMPAVLVECGFMDNRAEASLMLDKAYQLKCAEAMAKGICEYLGVGYKQEEVLMPHWAEASYESLLRKGIVIHDKRFDDNMTRGEIFALLDRIVK